MEWTVHRAIVNISNERGNPTGTFDYKIFALKTDMAIEICNAVSNSFVL